MSLAHELPSREPAPHELFEVWAHATPNATALRFGDRTLTYGELNAKANQMAHHLKARGVGAEAHVVVCFEPGFEIIVTLLAIFKLGAVYVPLDPSYPRARVQTMLDDTTPAVVVTNSDLRGGLPAVPTNVLELDTTSELRALPACDLNLAIGPSQTAYVYYTSGTTGRPKGVMASYANLASYLGSARRRYGFHAADAGVALARFTFSISMFELLSPLCSGGSLLLLPRAHVLDFAQLSEALRGVTFFHAGPSLLRSLLDHIKRHYHDFSVFDGVRHASSGGDSVPPELLQDLLAVFRRAEVFVIYGCSEISCMGTTFEVARDAPVERTFVGTSFPGTTVRVVADDLTEVPNGQVGEVLFAGPGVVKGYLNQSELTRQKFFEHDGLRFYRTGDRGKLDERGLLELLGRSDFQVKLGGIRIELGEIEHHLRRAPAVANGVVGTFDRDGVKALVAYVVIRPASAGDGASRSLAIRRYLAEQLPDYMVPGTFVELDALPLNHNMKVDRRALPDPPRVAPRAASEREDRPARSVDEQRLASIWGAVLGLDHVSLDDNFFELGGTSLLALRLIQRIDRELGVALTGLEVLRESLEVQALLCAQRRGTDTGHRAPGSSRVGMDRPELFHFGPDRSLYGVLYGAGRLNVQTAVLICAPLGQEAVRAHFVLQQLARRLAAAGAPALRFDYYGCLDSLGESREASCARWQRDIVAARRELLSRTGARRVTAIGVRLGATLLANAAQNTDFSQLVLWDPVEQGSAHLADLRRAHRRLLRASPLPSLRTRWTQWAERGPVELLGATYSRAALQELAALTIPRETSGSCAVASLRTEVAWLDLAKLENMLPDVGISQQLSQLALGGSP